MNKVKSGSGKKCTTEHPQNLKNDINIEEQLDKLSLKSKIDHQGKCDVKHKNKSVNGLVNGVDHKTVNKSRKDKYANDKIRNQLLDDPNKIINYVEHDPIASLPGTSDLKFEEGADAESKGAKSKVKAKKEEKTMPNCSSKIDYRVRLEEGDPSDFDIMSFIKSKYGDKKDDEVEIDKIETEANEKPSNATETEESPLVTEPNIQYVQYESELQMPMIMKIIQKDLSEPYSIYTYRYFIHNWPNLCFLAMCDEECVGAIVCKLDIHRKLIKRGYIAMLAVDKRYRKHGIGSTLVRMAIQEMIAGNADEVVLETEITNKPALRLYEALGFVRDKRLFRYYLNGVDALRLKLWLR